jgi:hypothetical protein
MGLFETVLKSMRPVQINEPAAAALACGFNSAVMAEWLQRR